MEGLDRMLAHYAGGVSGARTGARARATVVVVDAFRASATISVLVSKGARVISVASIEEASSGAADFRIGERGSAKVAGFDFGNSPTELSSADIPPGSTVLFSTTNGTRVVEAAAGAGAVLTGTFVNADCMAATLAGESPDGEVFVVGCGWKGKRSSEDEAASGAILCRLRERGAELDERARRVVDRYLDRPTERLRTNVAARRLLRLGYEKDLSFCLSEDTVPVVPRLQNGAFTADPL